MNLYYVPFNYSRDVGGDSAVHKMKKNKCAKKKIEAYGLTDYIINKLPEIHIPGYQYCGPGTELQKRLARGDPGINKLDQACKEHDIAYSKLKSSEKRREADRALIARAFPQVYSRNVKLGERAAALLVTTLMGAKMGLSKIGLGINSRIKRKKHQRRRKSKVAKKRVARSQRITRKRRKTNKRTKRGKNKNLTKKRRKTIKFGKLVRSVKTSIKKAKWKSPSLLKQTIRAAIRKARDVKRNKIVNIPRVLKVPKFGGSVLPILPILTALSAVGSIPATAVGVAKVIKTLQNITKKNISGETEEKIGKGLHLLRNGSGFYLKPFRQR